jgi:hypothetical protein
VNVNEVLANLTGIQLELAKDPVEAPSDQGAYVQLSSVLERTAVRLPFAREGFSRGKSIHQIAVLERKAITQETWDELFTIENLIHPTFIQGRGGVPGQG